mmetsp:Transcript_32574/g.57548  ORF Transcript_32574/g.57548 Transcript_32574/m.57548 type:complete len:248 (+) Transcript_32574:727-1470(+)
MSGFELNEPLLQALETSYLCRLQMCRQCLFHALPSVEPCCSEIARQLHDALLQLLGSKPLTSGQLCCGCICCAEALELFHANAAQGGARESCAHDLRRSHEALRKIHLCAPTQRSLFCSRESCFNPLHILGTDCLCECCPSCLTTGNGGQPCCLGRGKRGLCRLCCHFCCQHQLRIFHRLWRRWRRGRSCSFSLFLWSRFFHLGGRCNCFFGGLLRRGAACRRWLRRAAAPGVQCASGADGNGTQSS